MKIIPSLNNVICKINKRFIRGITNIIRAANENPGNSINPADFVNITGEIVSLPMEVSSKRRDYRGFSTKDMIVGDTAIFRYDVVFDFIEKQDGEAAFKNSIWYNGGELWNVDIQKIFAVIRNNEIIMVNGYCMIEGFLPEPIIIIPKYMRSQTSASKSILTHIGNNLTHLPKIAASEGDTVYYHPYKIQKYKINGKEFGIIQQSQVWATSVSAYGELVARD